MTGTAPASTLHEAFRDAVRASVVAQQETTEDRIAALREELQTLSRRLVTLDRQLLAHTRRREELRSLDGALERTDAELDRMLALPGVQTVAVAGSTLHVLTDPIQIAWDGVDYAVGSFRIVLDLAGDVRIESVSKVGPKPGWDHPHVQDGRPCLGNLREGMLKLIAEYELALAVQITLDFLATYQPESAYCALERWPRADATG
jgi:hypothetical protein